MTLIESETIETPQGDYTLETHYDLDAEELETEPPATRKVWGVTEQADAVYLVGGQSWDVWPDDEPPYGARDVCTILPDYAGCKAVGANPDTVAADMAETWCNYLNGNVYGYNVEGPDGEHVDSCWGFYPDKGRSYEPPRHMIAEAREAIELDAADRAKESDAVSYWQARDVETVTA